MQDPRGAGLYLAFLFSYVRSDVCLLRSNFGTYTFIKGQRDKGTQGQRDKGTKGQRDTGTQGHRDKGTKKFGTKELWNKGTLEQMDFGTKEFWNKGTLEHRNFGTTGL